MSRDLVPGHGRSGPYGRAAASTRPRRERRSSLGVVERLILARHAESAYNVEGLVNGDPAVAVGLTGRGEDEARALGRVLADEPIDLCLVTPLTRTRATAELALAGRGVIVEEAPDLVDPGAGAELAYRVTSVADVDARATTTQEVLGRPGEETVTLITCTGEWLPAAHEYAQRRVVIAERVATAS